MRMYAATVDQDLLTPRSRNAYYTRQKLLFVLVVTLVSLIPLVGISYFSFRYYKNSWIDRSSTELVSLADSRIEIIELFLNDQQDLMASLVALYSPEYISEAGNLEKIFNGVKHNEVITDLGVIDRSGEHLAYVGPFRQQLEGRNYSQAEWFTVVLSNGEYISDIFSGFRGVPHFVVAVTDPGETIILRATVNSDMFNSLLDRAEVGEGGDAFILNKDGIAQTPSRLGSLDLPVSLGEVAAGNSTSVYQTDDFIYTITPLKNGDWYLVLKEDIDNSLAGFYAARNRAILLIGMAVALIITVAAMLIFPMINRIKEADLQRMALNNRMLEVEKMALIGRLASSVSHEINNPLQIIESQAGWISDLLDDEQPERLENLEEYRGAIGKIRTHVRRARDITHRLLGLSRAGTAEPVKTDINNLIEDTVSFLENEADKNEIVIARNLDGKLPEIKTDASQLQQVFLNIINNAIEAIGRDGQITIGTRAVSGGILAEFSDSGTGIEEDVKKKIFDPFFTTKKGKGTGLGLSISDNIIQRLGGDIEVTTNEQGGSCFQVFLPE